MAVALRFEVRAEELSRGFSKALRWLCDNVAAAPRGGPVKGAGKYRRRIRETARAPSVAVFVVRACRARSAGVNILGVPTV